MEVQEEGMGVEEEFVDIMNLKQWCRI